MSCVAKVTANVVNAIATRVTASVVSGEKAIAPVIPTLPGLVKVIDLRIAKSR